MAIDFRALKGNVFLRYLVPFGAFLLLSPLPGMATNAAAFWWYYALKTAAVLALLAWFFYGHRQEIAGRFDPWAIIVGLIVLVPWLLYYHAYHSISDTPPFDTPWSMGSMIGIKFIGACVMAPILEELVFRSFLMRFIISEDFLSVPLGTYKFLSFWLTALAFTLSHPSWQWGVALLAAIAYGGYLVRSRNLFGCILAHTITNAGLWVYVIASGRWGLWL